MVAYILKKMEGMKQFLFFIVLGLLLPSFAWGQKFERRSYKQALNSVKFIDVRSYQPYLSCMLFHNDYWHLYELENVNISPENNKTLLKKTETGKGYVDMVFPICYLWNDKPQQVVLDGGFSNLAENDSARVVLLQETLNGTVMQEAKLVGSNNSTFRLTIPFSNKPWTNMCMAVRIMVNLNSTNEIGLHHLAITIDGKDIDEVDPITEANNDREFDESSKFILEKSLCESEIRKLEQICYLWGFLKYYHPLVRHGKYNWNYQLFRQLKLYAIEDECVFSQKLLETIPSWADLPLRNSKEPTKNIKNKVGFLWRNKFSSDIRTSINSIKKLKRGYQNVYHIGYPEWESTNRLLRLRNETAYDSIEVSDDGYRLLSLFRVWNFLYYFSPFMAAKEKHWIEILPKYIKIFAEARDKKAYDYACAQLICELKDTHSQMFGVKYYGIDERVWNPHFLPMDLYFCGSNMLITKLNSESMKNSGLKVGDLITEVNGVSMSEICKKKNNYSMLANPENNFFDGAYASFDTDSVCYTVLRKGRQIKVHIPDYVDCWNGVIETKPDTFKAINERTYYINLCVASEQQLTDGLKIAKGYRNIIFDMRGYPYHIHNDHGNIILGNFLFPDFKIVLQRDYADIEEPGVFLKNPDGLGYGKKNPDYYKGRAIVLVNSFTISQAERIAEIIRNAPDGIVVGEKTAGTLGQATYIPYLNGVWTRYTNYSVYEMSGRNTYPNGVKIDYQVNPKKLDLDRCDDYILDEALKITK